MNDTPVRIGGTVAAALKDAASDYETHRLSVVTDGSRGGTMVFLPDGERLRGVTRVQIDLSNEDKIPTATFTVELEPRQDALDRLQRAKEAAADYTP